MEPCPCAHEQGHATTQLIDTSGAKATIALARRLQAPSMRRVLEPIVPAKESIARFQHHLSGNFDSDEGRSKN
jgi:hypothetical protein